MLYACSAYMGLDFKDFEISLEYKKVTACGLGDIIYSFGTNFIL